MLRIGDSYRVPGAVQVTWWLLALNLLSFLASVYVRLHQGPMHSFDALIYVGGVVPSHFVDPGEIPPAQLLFSLVWYQFLHGGWFHLFSNSVALIVFGPNIEAYMGRWRFLCFYLTCGFAGALMHMLLNLQSDGPVIGASAAISGLLGAYLRVFPRNYIRVTVGNIQSGRYRDALIPIKVILVYWTVTQIVDALLPALGTRNTVAYLTHLGGFAAGYLLASGRGAGNNKARPRNFKVFTGGQSGVAG